MRRRNQDSFEEGDVVTLLVHEDGENHLAPFLIEEVTDYGSIYLAREDDDGGWSTVEASFTPEELQRLLKWTKDFQARGKAALRAELPITLEDLVSGLGLPDEETYMDQVYEWAATEVYSYAYKSALDDFWNDENAEAKAEEKAQEYEQRVIDQSWEAYVNAVESTARSMLRDAELELDERTSGASGVEECPGCLGLEPPAECPVHGCVYRTYALVTEDYLATLAALEYMTDVNELIVQYETPAEALASHWTAGVDSSLAKRQFDAAQRHMNPRKKTMAKKKKTKKKSKKRGSQKVPAWFAPRRFEFQGGTSNKFWEADIDGRELTTRWGRMGTKGQVTNKRFASEQKAQEEFDRLVGQKLAKGYTEISVPEPNVVVPPEYYEKREGRKRAAAGAAHRAGEAREEWRAGTGTPSAAARQEAREDWGEEIVVVMEAGRQAHEKQKTRKPRGRRHVVITGNNPYLGDAVEMAQARREEQQASARASSKKKKEKGRKGPPPPPPRPRKPTGVANPGEVRALKNKLLRDDF